MSVITMAKAIKEVNFDYIICFKVGIFYQCIGKDSYIMANLFNYNLSKNKENVSSCGFPEKSIERVKAKLEELKINYMLVDTKNNYNIDERFDNKELNTYEEAYEKAKLFVRKRNRIDDIHEKLMQDINENNIKEKLLKIEEIIYEE